MAKSQSELSLPGAFLLVNARHHSHCHCEEPKATKQCQYIRGGEEKKAWPGQKVLVFRHCEERKFLSLRGAQRRSNLEKGSLK